MATPEDVAGLAEAVQKISEDLKALAGDWDHEVWGPPLTDSATVSLSLTIDARNPVEAAEGLLDTIIRGGTDRLILEVRDRGTEETFFVRGGELVPSVEVMGNDDAERDT